MRVLMVSALWPPRVVGGAELYASQLAEHLRGNGHEVGVVTLGVPGDDVVATVPPFGYHLDEYSEHGRIRRSAFHLADLYRVATRRVLTDAIASFAPDVVHTHGLTGLSTSALTTPTAVGAAHVHTIHDHWLVCERLGRVRRDGTSCESICATCRVWSGARESGRPPAPSAGPAGRLARRRGEHEALLAWTRGRIRVVPPPVPAAPPAAPPAVPAGGPFTFGYLGRLEAAKGVRTLLAAFAAAPIDARLIIGGDGPLRGELAADAGPTVRFDGWVEGAQKDNFLGALDALVVPSECRELAGLVVLEARVRRLPVVGSAIGGIPELVAAESRPLLFAPGDRGGPHACARRGRSRSGAVRGFPRERTEHVERAPHCRGRRVRHCGRAPDGAMSASERVRVGYYATALGSGGGMERYTSEMLQALGRRDDVELVVAVPTGDRGASVRLAPDVVVDEIVVGGPGPIGRGLRERYTLGRAFAARAVDVVHGTKHFLPRIACPTVLTVQDVMVITWPDQYRRRTKYLLPRQYLRAMREATVIVTPSDATRDRMGGIDPTLAEKSVTVPNGVACTLLDAVPDPLPGLEGRDFALVVGDPSPRKNLAMLLDIWDDVSRETGLVLVAVGPEGWRSRTTRARLDALRDSGKVVWAGRVPDEQLRWCYDQAHMVLIPSREEGFGLPVVEALALGAPVIASTDPALVEVGAGLPRHVAADDAAGWARAIVDVAGRPRGARPPGSVPFPTWDECAAGTVDAYRLAISRVRGPAGGPGGGSV